MAISMLAVYARNDEARRMVAGFAAATPMLSPLWQQLDRALAADPLFYLRDEMEDRPVLTETPGGDRDDA